MSDLRFQNSGDEFYRRSPSRTGGLPAFVIRLGIAKDERTANYWLIGITILAILIALWFFMRGQESSEADKQQQTLYPPGSPAIRE